MAYSLNISKAPIAMLLASVSSVAAHAQTVSNDELTQLDPRGDIISDEEFETAVPSIETDPTEIAETAIDDAITQQKLEQENREEDRQDGAAELPALQDGDAQELIADAPVNDPEIDDPLVPLDQFDVQPFDEAEFTEAAKSIDTKAIRYDYRIDGLSVLDGSGASQIRPVSESDVTSRFKDLSALADGDGKASNAAMVAARMAEDQQLLVDIMSGQGYFDASVNGAVELPEDQSGELTVVLSVTPGKRYNLATITFDTGPTMAQNLIEENFVPKIGEPIVAERILASEANLSLALPQNGYPFITTGQRDILLDPETGTADYTLPIDVGPRSSYGDIVTTGTTAFDAEHIYELTRFDKGELYDSRKIDDLRQAMVATGLFSTIGIEATPSGEIAPDGTEYATINVTQEAGPARTLAGSGGFGTGQGIRLEGSWTHRNFFPPQGALIGSVIAGTQEQGISGTFRRSNAGKRDRTVDFTVSALRNDFEAFEAFTGRIAGRISYDSTPIWQKRITYGYGFEILATNEQDFNFETGERDRRTFYVAALPGQITYDTTNSLLNPTEGFRLTASVSPEASLGSGTQFYGRTVVEGTTYYQASNSFVLAGRLRLGSIAGVDRESIAPSRRFYAGGGGSVRGFGFQDVGPIDLENRPIGGRSLVEGAAEVRYRFGDYGVVGFVDAGQVYTSSIPEFDDLRYGVGVGARLYTNFGPLRFDVATPINRQPGESLISVYISIGQAF